MACSSKIKQGEQGRCLTEKIKYPSYKTCGIRNPVYKSNDFYFSRTFKRPLNRCLVEIYWTDYLYKSVSTNPNESLRAYYNSIVLYMKAMMIHLKEQYGLRYGNLSEECSAVLLIKRCLANIFSEEETSKLIMLLKLKTSCDCLD